MRHLSSVSGGCWSFFQRADLTLPPMRWIGGSASARTAWKSRRRPPCTNGIRPVQAIFVGGDDDGTVGDATKGGRHIALRSKAA